MNEMDLDKTPIRVIWEITRACTRSCKHCRIDGIEPEEFEELTTAEGKQLIDSIVALGTPWLVLTGGDPFERQDIFELVDYANEKGLNVSVRLSATDNLTENNLKKLKDSGCKRIELPLDGPGADLHDDLRGEPGSFEKVLASARTAAAIDLPLQINSVLSNKNHHLVPELMLVVDVLNPIAWKIFFLIPTGDTEDFRLPTTYEVRHLFLQIYELRKEVDFEVKVAEAPTFRRYSIERRLWEQGQNPGEKFNTSDPLSKKQILSKMPKKHGLRTTYWATGAGRGLIFITAGGEVYPDGFMPIGCGNIRERQLSDIYRNTPLLKKLRQPEEFNTKCVKNGCWARHICSGSRPRGYAYSGDPLGNDPLCFYSTLV